MSTFRLKAGSKVRQTTDDMEQTPSVGIQATEHVGIAKLTLALSKSFKMCFS